MSLYNVIMGENPAAADLLELLGLDKRGIPRYRDCWMTADWKHIHLLTRTGGSNRKDYADAIFALRRLRNFETDYDDEFDPTFMHLVYAVGNSGGTVAGNDTERGPAYMAKAFRILREHGLGEPHPHPKIEAIRQGSISVSRRLLDAIERSKPGTIVRIGEDGKVSGGNHG